MEIENQEQILQRRKEIEKEILEMLKETDAWNYFPHKALGGISLAEKLLEYQSKAAKH